MVDDPSSWPQRQPGQPSSTSRPARFLPRSTSASSTLSPSAGGHEAEEYELASPPAPDPCALGSQSTTNLADFTSSRSPKERTRGLSIHQLARQPTSLLFEHFHSPTSARRALPLNFTQEDEPAASGGARHRTADELDDEEEGNHGEEAGIGQRASAVLNGLGLEDDSFDVARAMRSNWKRRLFLLMEAPTSSPDALTVHWGVTFLIVFSAVLTILSTLPGVHTNASFTRVLFGLDSTVVVLFTVEYLLRLLAHSDSWPQLYGWALSFFGITDLLSIGPYYIELMIHADTSVMFRFSILRTFRLLRVFRAFTYSHTVILTIEVMRISIKLSQDALLALAFFILMVVIVFSTLLYFAERGSWDATLQVFVDADGDPSNFASIPAASWFVLVTLSTTGYGEFTPRSTLGRLCTVPLLAFGLLLIALPSFVLGRNFSLVWDHLRNVSLADGGSNTIYAADGSWPRSSADSRTDPDGRGRGTGDVGSGRGSMDVTPLPTSANGYASVAGGQSTGLSTLPMGSPEQRSASVASTARKRPNARTATGAGSSSSAATQAAAAGDLTNLKLARNQEALSAQIDGLRDVIESQGRLVGRLLEALEQTKGGDGRAREGVI